MPSSPVEPNLLALVALRDRLTSKLPSNEGHAAWRQVLAQVANLAEAAQALRDLHVTRDPMQTEAAHQKRVLLAAERFGRETTAAVNRINKIARDGLADIARRRDAKIHLMPDAYAAEVRDMYRRMSQSERTKLLGELIDQKRGPELAALLKAPISLTGMTEEYRGRWEEAFVARHAPDEVDEEAALKEAFEAGLVSAQTAGEVAAAYSDPKRLEEIARQEAKAAAAAQAFDDAATRVGARMVS